MIEVNTPTTEQIRWAYTNQSWDDNAETEFDLWLATERNRIAELAQKKLIDKIKEIRDRESKYGDYDYYYGLDALLEELGE